MKRPLRTLFIEDSEDDYNLLVRELARGDWDLTATRVETEDAMRAALAEGTFDLVISDFSLPRFDALTALKILHDSRLDLPFMIVSGTIGEDVAVGALKAGAHDFMVKDRLARLNPAVERELREATVRRKQREAETQLMIADRMVAVGTLAAGVAHEINNPLAALLANVELTIADLSSLQGSPETLQAVKEQLSDARAAANRVKSIVKDLKIFSRGESERRGPVNLERVMESTLRMARNEIRHRANVVTKYGHAPDVLASESRLGQVFLNLVVNAAQAIPEGRASENEIHITTSASDGVAIVEIADTGSGIPPEVMKRLFTPFVTTKPVGVGTGLGLSICHRIVTELGGRIEVETAAGKGTTFRVYLPSAPGLAESVESPIGDPGVAARRATILVIDDEEMIGKVVERALASEHDVTVLCEARDALARLETGERYDVILCDLMMPHMTGMEFHAELAKRVPEQLGAVVFLTGGAFTPAAREFLQTLPNRVLEKPFDIAKLRSLIAERLR